MSLIINTSLPVASSMICDAHMGVAADLSRSIKSEFNPADAIACPVPETWTHLHVSIECLPGYVGMNAKRSVILSFARNSRAVHWLSGDEC